MSRNTKATSSRIARLASETLQSHGASDVAKSLAASALAQASRGKQTGSKMEDVASRVIRGEKYAAETKELAASVLAQSNKAR